MGELAASKAPESSQAVGVSTATTSDLAPAASADQLLRLQRLAGNRAVVGILQRKTITVVPGQKVSVLDQPVGAGSGAGAAGRSGGAPLDGLDVPEGPSGAARKDMNQAAATTVKRLHAAFVGNLQLPLLKPALVELANLKGSMRQTVMAQFTASYSQTLRSIIADQMIDWSRPIRQILVRALGILEWGNDEGLEVAMGLALIPQLTRDEEVFRVLSEVEEGQRRTFARRYGRTFSAIKLTENDSLAEHLADDLSGWRLKKAKALLDHNLSGAESLYFSLLANKDNDVVKQVQSTWSSGMAAFGQLEWDWDRFVRNLGAWTDEAFDPRPMREVLRDELWGVVSTKDWNLVKAVLDAYEEEKPQKQMLTRPRTSVVGLTMKEDDAQLRAARSSLTAAGGVMFATTDEEQVTKALETITKVWRRRIERYAKVNPAAAKQLEEEWRQERARLSARLGTAVFGGDDVAMWDHDAKRARLALIPSPNEADKVFAAKAVYDFPLIVELVTAVWARGKINDYRKQAAKPTRDESGKIVRESFDPDWLIPTQSGHLNLHRRIRAISAEHRNDTQRGADRLDVEVSLVNSDGDLLEVQAFLMTEGLDAKRRAEIVKAYVDEHQPTQPGKDPVDGFVQALVRASNEKRAEGGEGSNLLRIKHLLTPTSDPKEIARRAKQREKASHTGVLSGLGDFGAAVAGNLSGEEEGDVAREAVRRLEWIANAPEADLQLMLDLTGAKDRAQLAQIDYRVFEARLADFQSIKAIIAQTVAGMFEVVVESALAALLGPAALAQVFNAVAAAMGNIVAQELILGADFEATSEENIRNVIQAGAGSMLFDVVDVRTKIAAVVNPKTNEYLAAITTRYGEDVADRIASSTQNLLASMVDRTATTIIMIGVDGVLQPKMPTADNMANEAYKFFWGTLARMAHGPALTYRVNPATRHDFMSFSQEFLNSFTFKMGVKLSEGVAKKVAELMSMDTRNMTWEEIFTTIGVSIAKGTVSNFTKAIGSAYGQHTRAVDRVAAVKKLFDDSPETAAWVGGIIVATDDKYRKPYAEYKDAERAAGRRIDEPGAWFLNRAIGDEKAKIKLYKEAGTRVLGD